MIQSTTEYKYKYVVFTSVYGRKEYNALQTMILEKIFLLFQVNHILVHSRNVIKSLSFGVKTLLFHSLMGGEKF
jgi:hypothetical protein